jgi:glucose/arabinose dehydrogenase
MRGEIKSLVFILGILLILSPITKTQHNISDINYLENDIQIVNIEGGFFKIKIEIKNNGENNIENLNWNISVEGGRIGLINKINSGVIENLSPGETTEIESKRLFGIGEITARVEINNYIKTYKGSVFLFYVNINPAFTIKLEEIANGFNSPTTISYPKDDSNRLFITDQIGQVYIIKDEELISEPFLDISEKIVELDPTYDERGLLGLVFHPDYQNNGKFYVYYSAPTERLDINHESILAEYKVSSNNQDKADINSERIILKIDEPEANHNGGHLEFGPDNYLYIGVGDGGGQGDQHGEIGNGQNKETLLGNILRIDVDGTFPYENPVDNPFIGKEGLDEIFAYGFRNPWRFSFDEKTDRFFVADVGQDEWEEINIVEKGGNYGWRILEGTHDYDIELADELGININSLKEPIHEYSHSVGRSICGGYIYRGNIIPELKGKYIFADWSTGFFVPNGKIYYLEETNPNKWTRFNIEPEVNFNQFILSLGQDQDGELYILSKTNLGPSGTSGVVNKIII